MINLLALWHYYEELIIPNGLDWRLIMILGLQRTPIMDVLHSWLQTDPGLEVRKHGGGWIPLSSPSGEFVIDFGEMLESWTEGKIKALPHRVIGTSAERISVSLFFNPNHDSNVAPIGSGRTTQAWTHLKKIYVHLQKN